MISLRESLAESERQAERERLLKGCYTAAIQSTREYVVEIEPALASRFRLRMAALEQELAASAVAEEYQTLQSSFRGELRLYRDRCQELVARLRTQVASAGAAMQTLTESVSANGAGYEAELNREVARLEQAAEIDDLPSIRATIGSASAAIQRSFEQMQRRNQMVIAQLQDEIRSLHQTMENERRAMQTDGISGAWNQRKLAERFDQLLKLDESFAVLLLAIVNWRQAAQEHSPQSADACLRALVTHLKATFSAEGMVGRWSDNVLAVIVETDPSAAAEAVSGVTRELAAGYPPAEFDRRTGLTLQIKAALVGRKRGTNAAQFYPQLGQHVTALTA